LTPFSWHQSSSGFSCGVPRDRRVQHITTLARAKTHITINGHWWNPWVIQANYSYIEFLLARYSRAPPVEHHMLCEIGARVSCEQRGHLWEIITQLHKQIRRCAFNWAGPYKLENTFGVKHAYLAPHPSPESLACRHYTPMLTIKHKQPELRPREALGGCKQGRPMMRVAAADEGVSAACLQRMNASASDEAPQDSRRRGIGSFDIAHMCMRSGSSPSDSEAPEACAARQLPSST